MDKKIKKILKKEEALEHGTKALLKADIKRDKACDKAMKKKKK